MFSFVPHLIGPVMQLWTLGTALEKLIELIFTKCLDQRLPHDETKELIANSPSVHHSYLGED